MTLTEVAKLSDSVRGLRLDSRSLTAVAYDGQVSQCTIGQGPLKRVKKVFDSRSLTAVAYDGQVSQNVGMLFL